MMQFRPSVAYGLLPEGRAAVYEPRDSGLLFLRLLALMIVLMVSGRSSALLSNSADHMQESSKGGDATAVIVAMTIMAARVRVSGCARICVVARQYWIGRFQYVKPDVESACRCWGHILLSR